MSDGTESSRMLPGFRAVTRRAVVPGRREVLELLDGLESELGEAVSGPAFFFTDFITDSSEGIEVRAGFPVRPDTPGCVSIQGMEVLEIVCPAAEAAGARSALYGAAESSGLISDEYTMDSYPNWLEGDRDTVAVRFIVHSWHRLLWRSLERELGAVGAEKLRHALGEPAPSWGLEERFAWTQRTLTELSRELTEPQMYRVVSSCAHIFPSRILERLRTVFEEAVDGGATEIEAVDAVRVFMSGAQGGWGEPPERRGTLLVASKHPRDPAAFRAATTREERGKACCFCPVVRNMLGRGMPDSFCLCGAGWFRQQWEAILRRPVRVRVVESLLSGDDRCTVSLDLAERVLQGVPS
jgi:hypothetical protein